MKNTIKKIAMLLAFCMLFSGCVSADNSKKGIVVTDKLSDMPVLVGDIPCEFPLVSDDTSLNVLITGYEGLDANEVYVWKKYKEMTGVDINWTTVKKSERSEAVYTALTNKNKLDLIIRCKISSNTLTQYGENGLILDLAKDGLLEKNAPNCWAYLQSHPDALASVTTPDGAIYSLPQVNSGAELRVSRKIFINKNWLDKVNMDIPTTTEEFYEVLKAFKEQDANSNGDKNDEIPFCPYDLDSLDESLYGAFGLGNRGSHNLTVDCDDETGKVRLIVSSDGYKAYLEYLNRLYNEKLLDSHVFTITMDEWLNNAENDRIGVFAATNLASLPADKMDNWVAVEEAIEGPNGDKMWTPIRANFHSTGAAVIPSTCENPELVLRWLDYFWTDEGTLFYHMGIEGETFVVNDDGSFDYTKEIYDQMKDGNTFDDVVAKYSPYPGGSNPLVEIAPYFKGGEMADIPAEAARKLFEYGTNEYWPSFTFTAEEADTLETVQSDITKYYKVSRVEFVTGTKSFDDWDNYCAQIDSLGEQKMLKIYQSAVDRYYKLKEKQN